MMVYLKYYEKEKNSHPGIKKAVPLERTAAVD